MQSFKFFIFAALKKSDSNSSSASSEKGNASTMKQRSPPKRSKRKLRSDINYPNPKSMCRTNKSSYSSERARKNGNAPILCSTRDILGVGRKLVHFAQVSTHRCLPLDSVVLLIIGEIFAKIFVIRKC